MDLSIEERPWGDKYSDFAKWFHEVIKHGDIVDIRYPVKGMIVWKPYGLKTLRIIQRILIDLLEKTGHEEAYFPMMIPESIFSKEKQFLEGFGGESLVVEGTLTRRFNEKLFVRPTSETVMYYMWSIWIKGRGDLPVKMYQVVNVFRYETKMTHPILRVREIMGFIEAHTAHATREEAEEQVREALTIYKKFFDTLLIPYFIVKTPPWDTFAGAEYNYDFVTAMPDGKGLEIGSVINLGQRFAQAFDIKFMDTDGSVKYVYQTCYGISERTLGAVIGIHGDERGLFFPPKIAPIQVVVIPIAKPSDIDLINYADSVAKILADSGIRVFVDKNFEKTPGWKYYYWEFKGTPLRIEIGSRELRTRTVTLARRDTLSKITIPLDNLIVEIENIWKDIEMNMYRRALDHLKKMCLITSDLGSAQAFKGLVITPWDGSRECAEYLEKETGKPLIGEIVESPIELGSCKGRIVCGDRVADRYALLGVTY
ncbi:MAG: proline--tRNA ligase [Desulfurococcaceae archaeon]